MRVSKVFGAAAICIFFTNSCASASVSGVFSPATILVGSTPCGEPLRMIFAIPSDKAVDFIRWQLTLNEAEKGIRRYTLHVNYGEGQPNTNGFRGGGETRMFAGKFGVEGGKTGNVYRFEIENSTTGFSLVRLNENLFHLLTPDGKLMAGSGGWSYSLNRRVPVTGSDTVFSSRAATLQNGEAGEVTFVGRTPCAEIAGDYKWTLERECAKLKWKLTLLRDQITREPSEYAIQRTLERPNILRGKWAIVSRKESVIIQLDPDIPEKQMSLLVGDDNVLFFLDKQGRLYPGNEDFSYTLNRVPK